MCYAFENTVKIKSIQFEQLILNNHNNNHIDSYLHEMLDEANKPSDIYHTCKVVIGLIIYGIVITNVILYIKK